MKQLLYSMDTPAAIEYSEEVDGKTVEVKTDNFAILKDVLDSYSDVPQVGTRKPDGADKDLHPDTDVEYAEEKAYALDLMKNDKDTVIYVGKAKNLRSLLLYTNCLPLGRSCKFLKNIAFFRQYSSSNHVPIAIMLLIYAKKTFCIISITRKNSIKESKNLWRNLLILRITVSCII